MGVTGNAYEDDARTAGELTQLWMAGPLDTDPARSLPSGAPATYSLPRLSEIRCALFAKLHCPESIRRPKSRKT